VSLFGWREKRRIADLEAREARHLAKIEELTEAAGDFNARMLAQKAVARQRGEDLARLSNRQANTERYANETDTSLGRMELRLDRALRACLRVRRELAAQYRVNDRLSDQLMGSMGYSDVALSRLGVDLASTKAGGAS
jgi:hypothetical protein